MEPTQFTLQTPATADLINLGASIGMPRNAGTEEFSRPFVIVPEGYKVESLEPLGVVPWRKTAAVTMRDAASFCEYIDRQGGRPSIYGRRDDGSFVAILDDNTYDGPDWRSHRVTFAVQSTKEWKVWNLTSGKKMTQTDFATFIEDNLPDIINPVGAEMLEMCRLLEAKKRVEFVSGVRLANGENELSYQESISGTVGNGKLPVPEAFTIAVQPFEGADRFSVEARLRYRIGDDKKLVMWFDLDRPHKVLEVAISDVWKLIEEILGVTILNGTP